MNNQTELQTASDLCSIAARHKTDKFGSHYYTKHYDRFFAPFRDKEINLLEIGIGGYHDPNRGGESLRTWKEYFGKARIFGIDLYEKTGVAEDRIRVFQGSQIDETFLNSCIVEIGHPDLIIDDGSHINSHVIETFRILFPHLKAGGIYVIEDLQTSYWDEYGGDSYNLRMRSTSMNFLKGLTDGLNYEEFRNPAYEPSYFDKNIVGISFFHNLVFIEKGNNTEGSNLENPAKTAASASSKRKHRILAKFAANAPLAYEAFRSFQSALRKS